LAVGKTVLEDSHTTTDKQTWITNVYFFFDLRLEEVVLSFFEDERELELTEVCKQIENSIKLKIFEENPKIEYLCYGSGCRFFIF
jgi:hypothetical protein